MLVHLVILFTIKLYARINIFNYKIIVKCKWESGCAVSYWVDSWQSLGGGSGGKAPEKALPFFLSEWHMNSLK